MSTKRAFFDRFHRFGQKLYKPSIVAKKENMTFWEIVKDMFGLLYNHESDITRHHHRASSTERLLKERLKLDANLVNKYRWDLKIKQ